MHDILQRFWEHLIGRSTGLMNFRLLIQPTVAIVLAIRAGLADAREGRPAFLWTAITNRTYRPELLRQAWKDLARVFVLIAALDAIYQLVVHRGVFLGELLIVVIVLAIVPYILVRGPVTRIRRRLTHDQVVRGDRKRAA